MVLDRIINNSMLETLVLFSTHANIKLRTLHNTEPNPDVIDLVYVLYVNTPETGWVIKIGRTTLAHFDQRMSEHIRTWGRRCISFVSVMRIQHWTIETKFHRHMKNLNDGRVLRVTNKGRTFDEFYTDITTVDELEKFIELNSFKL